MGKAHPFVRDAGPDDAEALFSIWTDFTADPPRLPRLPADLDEVRCAVRKIAADPHQRLVVAVTDDEPVGVAHLRLAPVSPIHGEDAVHVGYLHVLCRFRRRGLGKQLMEAAADWADASGSHHLVASVAATSRESNRFLARLGLAQVAVVRATTVSALRGKLRPTARQPVSSRVVTVRRLTRFSAGQGSAGR